AAGSYKSTPNTLPPTLDVEFGRYSTAGLSHMEAVLKREYGRVNIYTGCWYWEPHHGFGWTGPEAWISGYPFAHPCAGMPASRFTQHQYSDHGFNGVINSDMNVFRGTAGEFKTFAHVSTPPPPSKKHEELLRHIKRRNELR